MQRRIKQGPGESECSRPESTRKNILGPLPNMTIEREPNSSSSASPLSTPAVTNFVGAAEPVIEEGPPSPIRQFLRSRGSGGFADKSFAALMLVCALSIFAIVLFILTILILRSRLSLQQFGFHFFLRSAWDPVSGDFGALPFIFGTLVTSLLALAMAVPLALCVAIFLLSCVHRGCVRRSRL